MLIHHRVNFVPACLKRSFYKISKVPTGKKNKIRWIFNPIDEIKPQQKAITDLFYLFTPMLSDSLAGGLPGRHLSTAVKEYYTMEDIYVTDIQGFFKSVNRTVLYKAMDRLIYKMLIAMKSQLQLGSLMQLHIEDVYTYQFNDATLQSTTIGSKSMYKDLKDVANIQAKDVDLNKVSTDEYKYFAFALLSEILCKMIAMPVPGRTRKQEDKAANKIYMRDILSGSLANVKELYMKDKLFIPMCNENKLTRPTPVRTPWTTMIMYMQGFTGESKPCTTTDSVIQMIRHLLYALIDLSTTHRNSLPEGAPTSPILANFVLDSIAADINASPEISPDGMVLYMDDISFGFNIPLSRAHKDAIDRRLTKILNSYGLKQHHKKTHVFNKKGYREVLGVNLTPYKGKYPNVTIRPSRKYRRNLRVTVFQFKKMVRAYHQFIKNNNSLNPDEDYVKHNYPKTYTATAHYTIGQKHKKIMGMISWMQSLSPDQAEEYVREMKRLKKDCYRDIQEAIKARSLGLINLHLIK